MRKLFHSIVAGLALAGAIVAAVNLVPAWAQVAVSTTTDPHQPEPRQFPSQQTHYIRTTFNFNSCTQSSNICTVKLMGASLPYNSVVLRVTAVIFTAFNSTSTDVIILGTTAANANEIVSSSCNIHAVGVVACTMDTGGPAATGATTAQSGKNGGFDLYMKWTGGGGTPSAGRMALIVEYIPPNDGLCVVTPFGSTNASC